MGFIKSMMLCINGQEVKDENVLHLDNTWKTAMKMVKTQTHDSPLPQKIILTQQLKVLMNCPLLLRLLLDLGLLPTSLTYAQRQQI